VHDHLEHGDGRDADGGEVVRVGAPWVGFVDGLLRGGGVGVERIFGRVDELHGVLELWCLLVLGGQGVDGGALRGLYAQMWAVNVVRAYPRS
jgi:hypothetical protein